MDDQPEPSEESIASLAGRLADEGKQFARAELAVYRARLTPRVTDVRNATMFGIVAVFIVHAVVVALLVGLILSLVAPLGPGGATVVVVAGGLILAALLGWAAYFYAKRAFAKEDPRT